MCPYIYNHLRHVPFQLACLQQRLYFGYFPPHVHKPSCSSALVRCGEPLLRHRPVPARCSASDGRRRGRWPAARRRAWCWASAHRTRRVPSFRSVGPDRRRGALVLMRRAICHMAERLFLAQQRPVGKIPFYILCLWSIHIYSRVYAHVPTLDHTNAYAHVYTHVCTDVHTLAHEYVHAHVHTQIRRHAHVAPVGDVINFVNSARRVLLVKVPN